MKNNKLINALTSYLPNVPYLYVYMLQQVEYNASDFLSWVLKVPNYTKLKRRKNLVLTKKALGLLFVSYALWLYILYVIFYSANYWSLYVTLVILIFSPILISLLLAIIVIAGNTLITLKRYKNYSLAKTKLNQSKALRVVVMGSYGKTTAKEVLSTVIGNSKNVKASPGNMNVPISHARWIANKVKGDEDVLIFEVGEGAPGDIEKFAKLLAPDVAVVTGYAPNHLNKYKTEAALKKDLESISKFVKPENIYVADQAMNELSFPDGVHTYGPKHSDDWTVSNFTNGLTGITFNISDGKETCKITSSMIGEHNVGALVLAFSLGKRLGISSDDIVEGAAKTKAFDHRMQVSQQNGAWLIDDTYNGNLEGIRAGLELLKSTEAKRKIYVTPGLVEQGKVTEKVHTEIGKLIAEANPDVVVLMQNSVCEVIKQSLLKQGYVGKLRIESDPLHFYNNLQYEIATGDLVLMQNDWTDNYN